jgi:hypothetical protein
MKVTLLKPLTLAGKEYVVGGERPDVDAATAAWLAEQKVIEPLPATATTTGKAAGSKES